MDASAELNRIADRNRGELEPQALVDASEPVGAPLHKVFEWDDAIAGNEHRLSQARRFIRLVYVAPEPEGDESRVYHPEFVHVERVYRATSIVVQQPDLYELALLELVKKVEGAEASLRELKRVAEQGGAQSPERLATIHLATQGISTVRAAIRTLRS